jgi:hypothetical protein
VKKLLPSAAEKLALIMLKVKSSPRAVKSKPTSPEVRPASGRRAKSSSPEEELAEEEAEVEEEVDEEEEKTKSVNKDKVEVSDKEIPEKEEPKPAVAKPLRQSVEGKSQAIAHTCYLSHCLEHSSSRMLELAIADITSQTRQQQATKAPARTGATDSVIPDHIAQGHNARGREGDTIPALH